MLTKSGWDAENTGAPVLYGLEPFVFEPGPLPSQDELVKTAEKKIRLDRRFQEMVRARKAEITKILQGCLNAVNDQLERGEPPCTQAHFPLLNPFNFEDLEALAQHNFSIDLHADEVDRSLMEFASALLQITWDNAVLENVSKAQTLERYVEALQNRMQTLEHHLSDRSRQLSNCRFAYFLEITHLRNQLYISDQKGSDFKAVEAYFFDPTDFLEEELRQQLNEKIKLSIKVYHDRLVEMQIKVEDLEMKLASAEAMRNSMQNTDLDRLLQVAITHHGLPSVIQGVHGQGKKEMELWAADWATKAGWALQTGQSEKSAAELETLQQKLQEALNMAAAERRNSELLQQEIASLGEKLALSEQKVQEAEAAHATALQAVHHAEARVFAAHEAKAVELKRPTGVDHAALKDLEQRNKTLEEEIRSLEKQVAQMKEKLSQADEEVKAAKSLAGDPPKSEESDADRLACEEIRRLLGSAGSKLLGRSLLDHVGAVALEFKQHREQLSDLQASLTQLQATTEAARKQAEEERAAAEKALRAASEAESRRSSLQEMLEEQRRLSSMPRPSTSKHLETSETHGGGDGEEVGVEAQTNITFFGGGFYMLEPPPSELETSIQDELSDLIACATSNWEASLQSIKASYKPPLGSGRGFCQPGAFMRLFVGAQQHLKRLNELIAMINVIKRAELQNVLEGVHLLMESNVPDSDLVIRDCIFGRGFTQGMLDAQDRLNSMALEKRWGKLLTRIIRALSKATAPVQLGYHIGRRIFVPGGGGGEFFWSGGAGGGLAARQRKDFSPPRSHDQYGHTLEEGHGASILEGQSQMFSSSTLFDSMLRESEAQSFCLRGRSVHIFDSSGHSLSPPGSPSPSRSPSLLIPSPQNGHPRRPKHASRSPDSSMDRQLGKNFTTMLAPSDQVPRLTVQTLSPEELTPPRRLIQDRTLLATPETWSRPGSARSCGQQTLPPPSRAGSLVKEDSSASGQPHTRELLEPVQQLGHENAPSPRNGAVNEVIKLAAPPEGDADSHIGGAHHQVPQVPERLSRGAGREAEYVDLESMSHVPLLYVPFGSVAANEIAARLAHAVATAAPGGVNAAIGAAVATAGTGFQAVRQRSRPQSGCAGTRPGSVGNPITAFQDPLALAAAINANVERNLERARQHLSEACGNLRATGPIPSWELENCRGHCRAAGGRHTNTTQLRRPASAAALPAPVGNALNRGVSCGQLRPATGVKRYGTGLPPPGVRK